MAGFSLTSGVARTVLVGPFLDASGVPVTNLTINYTDVLLSKNYGPNASKNDTSISMHTENGYYLVPLNSADTTKSVNLFSGGCLEIIINMPGALLVRNKFTIIDA